MHSKHHRVPMYGILTAALLLSGATAAQAAVDPAPIGPDQYFTGVVNGANAATEKSVIQVVCAGPVSGSSTGHPVAGQYVYVTSAPSSGTATLGYTGAAGTSVVVGFGVASTSQPLVLKSYEVKAEIPTTLNLPCNGTGEVTFTPAPTSSTAKPSVVPVAYENIAVTGN